MSVFGVILVHIFPYLVRMRENVDQTNSEYGHFLRSVTWNIVTEAAVRRCSSKEVFWKMSQISQENTCFGVPF